MTSCPRTRSEQSEATASPRLQAGPQGHRPRNSLRRRRLWAEVAESLLGWASLRGQLAVLE